MSVKNRRIQMGWSQEHLAQVSGLSTRTVQRIEAGRKPGLDSLKALAAVFETDTATLIEDYAMTNTPEIQKKPEEEQAAQEAPAPKPAEKQPPRLEGNAYNAAEEQAEDYMLNIKAFKLNVAVFVLMMPLFYFLNLYISPGFMWVKILAAAWILAFALHAMVIKLMFGVFDIKWEERVKNEYRNRKQ